MTWNICCAPTMYGRLYRLKKIHRKLAENSKEADIIFLQELVSFRAGYIFYYLQKIFYKLFYYLPVLALYWDHLMITEGLIEGLLFPAKLVDNEKKTIEFAKSLGYKYHLSCGMPGYYINQGLLILSKFPLSETKLIEAPRAGVNNPGTLYARVKIKNKSPLILNSHFLPILRDLRPSYLFAKIINKILKHNPKKNRLEHLRILEDLLKNKEVIFGGDLNFSSKTKEYRYVIKKYKLKNTSDENLMTFRGIFIKDRLDHILVSRNIKPLASKIIDSNRRFSDHKPLLSRIEI